MDGLGLLAEAHAAGLTVAADGDRLVIAGPRDAEPTAARLLADKASVLTALTQKPTYRPLDPQIAADVAWKYSRAVIVARVERLDARGALPAATALDRVVADDWRRVLAVKQGGRPTR